MSLVPLGLGSSKDWEPVKLSRGAGLYICYEQPVGFVALYRRTPLHAGLVIIVPNVKPALQRQLFEAALRLIGERDLVNTVIEVGYSESKSSAASIRCRRVDSR